MPNFFQIDLCSPEGCLARVTIWYSIGKASYRKTVRKKSLLGVSEKN